MRFYVMTLFPDMMKAVLGESIVGRGQRAGLFSIEYFQIRDYSKDKHRKVDDTPYGGGGGMIMTPQPIYDCFQAVCEKAGTRPHLIYLSPQGRVLNQEVVKELYREHEDIALLCGHYEGVDERILEELEAEEISMGDFVLTGGEIPAMALIDAVCRMIPGVLGEEMGFEDESHFDGLLEYPQYTRPPEFRGRGVPEVLLSGHHENVDKWRREQSIERTRERRPDLYEKWKNPK